MVKMSIQPPRLEAFEVKVGKSRDSHVLGGTLDLDSEGLGLNTIFNMS